MSKAGKLCMFFGMFGYIPSKSGIHASRARTFQEKNTRQSCLPEGSNWLVFACFCFWSGAWPSEPQAGQRQRCEQHKCLDILLRNENPARRPHDCLGCLPEKWPHSELQVYYARLGGKDEKVTPAWDEKPQCFGVFFCQCDSDRHVQPASALFFQRKRTLFSVRARKHSVRRRACQYRRRIQRRDWFFHGAGRRNLLGVPELRLVNGHISALLTWIQESKHNLWWLFLCLFQSKEPNSELLRSLWLKHIAKTLFLHLGIEPGSYVNTFVRKSSDASFAQFGAPRLHTAHTGDDHVGKKWIATQRLVGQTRDRQTTDQNKILNQPVQKILGKFNWAIPQNFFEPHLRTPTNTIYESVVAHKEHHPEFWLLCWGCPPSTSHLLSAHRSRTDHDRGCRRKNLRRFVERIPTARRKRCLVLHGIPVVPSDIDTDGRYCQDFSASSAAHVNKTYWKAQKRF